MTGQNRAKLLMLLTIIQLKIHALIVSCFAPSCANEYAKKEKEKNTTIFTKSHEKLLMTICNYLFNNMLVVY